MSVGIVAGMGLLAYVLVLPFTSSYVALFGELDTVREKTPLLAIETHLGVFLLITFFGLGELMSRRSRRRSGALDPLFLAPFLGTLLVLRLVGVDRSEGFRNIADSLLVMFVVGVLLHACFRSVHAVTALRLSSAVLRSLVVIVGVTANVALITGRPVLALFLGIAGVASVAWLLLPDGSEKFGAAMIAAAMFVGAGLEIVYLVDDLSGGPYYRMNTVFKFYNGIWILLALACAGLIGRMIAISNVALHPEAISLRRANTDQSPQRSNDVADPAPARNAIDLESQIWWNRNWLSRNWARVGLVVVSLSIGASLAFPIFSTGVRLDQHFSPGREQWTLNAFDWMDYGTIRTQRGEGGVVSLAYDEDRAVIEWFNTEVPGTPVIAEASINAYACGGSRISVGTGLPVVLGWFRHEQQQRYQTHLGERRDDLRSLYTSPNLEEKRDIIARYRIEYIVVGDIERNYLTNSCAATEPTEGISAFDGMVGQDLEVAFTTGETVVYRVVG